MRRSGMGLVALGLTASVLTGGAPASAGADTAEYVVIYRPGVSRAMAQGSVAAAQIAPKERFFQAVNGISADLTVAQREALALDPTVLRVEPNIELRAGGSQVDPPWGLDRLDQGSSSTRLDGGYTYDDAAQGASVNMFVFDSGLRTSHSEFSGRVQPGRNFIAHTDPGEAVPNSDVSDCHGHGTHVTGTAAGTVSGVAKQARIVPVRVLDCDGSGDLVTVLSAIDWVIAQVQAPANAGYRAVANMSFAGNRSATLNEAVTRMSQANIAVAVAAGNNGGDLAGYSPASESTSVTVGALDNTDTAASFSNRGSGLDVWAPGVGIRSAWIGADNALATLQGTSMAAPHVAGVMAVLRSKHPADVTVADGVHATVAERLAQLGRTGAVRPAGDSASSSDVLQSPTGTSPPCTVADGFVASSTGTLYTLDDLSVLTGSGSLRAHAVVGSGWSTSRHAWYGTAGDGVVYLISKTGELRWYHFALGRWQPGSGRIIGTGWNLGRGLQTIEVTPGGDFYVVTSTGVLKLYRHNGWQSGSPSWSIWTIGSGWRNPQVLAPAGNGVLYRQHGGKLYWYKHSDPSGGPLTWQARAVGGGWRFSDLVPAGRGVLYGVNSTGYVRAYNHTGFGTGAATWDDIHDKGRIAAALGMVLAPQSCPG